MGCPTTWRTRRGHVAHNEINDLAATWRNLAQLAQTWRAPDIQARDEVMPTLQASARCAAQSVCLA